MRKRHVVIGGAIAAVVSAVSSASFGAIKSSLDNRLVFDKQSSLNSDFSLGLVGPAGFLAAGGPEASGTWVGPAVNISANPPKTPLQDLWHVPSNWSSNSVPNGATDVATFNDNGDAFGYGVLVDAPLTLAQFVNNNEAGTDVFSRSTAGTQTVTTGTGGLVLNAAVLAFDRSPSQSTFVTTGERFDLTVAGSGALIKNGPGDLFVTRNNTHTGGTVINGGRIIIANQGTAVGAFRPAADFSEGVFGAGSLVINGGGLYLRSTGTPAPAFSMTKNVLISGTADIEFNGTASPLFTGVISGTGNLRLGDGGDSIFQTAMTYTGETIIDDYNFHTLQLNGSNVNSSLVRNFGRYDMLNGAVNGINRHGDSAAIVNYGSEIVLGGNSDADAIEDVGNIVLRAGMNVISIRNPGFSQTTLAGDALVRDNRSTMVIRGQNLGASTAGFARSKITFSTAPTLTGGLVPFAYGLTADDPLVEDEVGLGRGRPVTYDADGLRPLRDSEMNVGFLAGANVRVAGGGAFTGTVNSLTLEGPGTTTGSIAISSGVVVENTVGNTIAANLNFGSAEGVFHTISDADNTSTRDAAPVAGLTVSGVISGSNGLTKGGAGDLILTGANTYTGSTVITNGRLVLTSNVQPNVAGPVGQSNDVIELLGSGNGGTAEWQGIETGLINGTAGTVTIGRNLRVSGQHQAAFAALLGGTTPTSYTRIDGNIDLGGTTASDVSGNNVSLTLDGGVIDIAGVISGPGRLQDDGVTDIILRGANTYSGGTEMGPVRFAIAGTDPVTRVARYQIGNDQAFGTGPVFVNVITQFQALGGPRTISNDFQSFDGLIFSGTDSLTFNGNFDLNFNAFGLSNYNVGTALTVTFNGQFKNGGILKAGIGTMILNGASQFSNVVQVGGAGNATLAISSGGVLVARNPSAFGTGGTSNNFVRVLDGSTVVLDAANGNINMPTKEFVLNGNGVGGTLGALHNASGNNTIGVLDLIRATSVGTLNAPTATIFVAGGSSLAASDYLDLTGAGTAASGTTPALRGPGIGSLTKSGPGVLSINRIFNTETVVGALPLAGGTVNSAVTQLTKKPIAGLNVAGGTLRITAGTGANQADKLTSVQTLTVAGGASLDLSNNAMVVDYTGASPRAALEDLLETGRAGSAWNGPGINSSSAAAGPIGRFAIGIAEQTDTSFTTSYFGAPIDSTSLLLRYTVSGDANLDGTTNITDFAFLAANFNQPGRWATGDFNYDGTVNIGDFSLLAANFNQVVPGDLPRGASVPEPAALSLIGLGVAGLAARRRRA